MSEPRQQLFEIACVIGTHHPDGRYTEERYIACSDGWRPELWARSHSEARPITWNLGGAIATWRRLVKNWPPAYIRLAGSGGTKMAFEARVRLENEAAHARNQEKCQQEARRLEVLGLTQVGAFI